MIGLPINPAMSSAEGKLTPVASIGGSWKPSSIAPASFSRDFISLACMSSCSCIASSIAFCVSSCSCAASFWSSRPFSSSFRSRSPWSRARKSCLISSTLFSADLLEIALFLISSSMYFMNASLRFCMFANLSCISISFRLSLINCLTSSLAELRCLTTSSSTASEILPVFLHKANNLAKFCLASSKYINWLSSLILPVIAKFLKILPITLATSLRTPKSAFFIPLRYVSIRALPHRSI